MGGLERRVTVQIPADEIQQKVDTRLREVSKQVKIKGFRPGRVPMSVIRQRYGRQVRLEITNETLTGSMPEALREQRRSWNPGERAPKAGDQVLFDYVAHLGDQRVPAEGNQRLAI